MWKMFRIKAKTLLSLIANLVLPFSLGVLIFVLLNYLFNTEEQRPTPIVPFALSLNPTLSKSAWIRTAVKSQDNNESTKKLNIITATYCRPSQFAELTRLAQAIIPFAKKIQWMIYDDAEKCSKSNLIRLRKLLAPFRRNLKDKSNRLSFKIRGPGKMDVKSDKYTGKGVNGRNAALKFLRKKKIQGVVYFADDDNTYDSQIFEQMLDIEIVGMLPVGAMYKRAVSSPIVQEGKVTGFYDGWIAGRKFPVDFAGFAINSQLILQYPSVKIRSIGGYMESHFLSDLGTNLLQIEPLAFNCTKLLTWHTKILQETKGFFDPSGLFSKFFLLRSNADAFKPPLDTTNIPKMYKTYIQHYLHNF